MKLIFSFCVLFVSFGVIIGKKWDCGQKGSDKSLDDLMSKLLTFGTDRKYPESQKAFTIFCSENYKLIKDIEDYNKQCLDNTSKQSTGLILYSIKSLIDSYCKKNSKYRKKLMEAAPCANKATKEYNKCHIGFTEALMSTKGIADKKQAIPKICCEYHKIFDCVHELGRKVPGCTDNILDTSEEFIRAHFERVFNLLCADYGDHTDRCDKVSSPPKLTAKNRKTRPKTFILPLIDVIKNLHGEE